jgi:putative transposase
MLHNPNHHRRSIRLKGFDYSQEGLYYITICVQNRECLFRDITVGAYPCGRPNDDCHPYDDNTCRPNDNITNIGQPQGHAPTMQLNDAGKMVEKQWLALPDRFPNVELHEFVVMPDHFHGILEINGRPLINKTVGDMMDAFKSITTVEYIRGVKTMGWIPFNSKLWQRNYYEHIIRDYDEFVRVSDYIRENPEKWKGL